ncbi:hypothetical protein HYPSUDRAFT_209026 [Hypholoma sublateritium FD-334 SS-4]|uniref:Uncharacterized protein n=1 Tax=Hypholoma sublateritium (strain FD-334 SS-4) TaxID=945553 RepID=A0A0D2KHG5_HYPSF|nr:hypothetical protein HYPSUDRAFT_209026 [Hypholoma sublateritium FD-334 SS-4]
MLSARRRPGGRLRRGVEAGEVDVVVDGLDVVRSPAAARRCCLHCAAPVTNLRNTFRRFVTAAVTCPHSALAPSAAAIPPLSSLSPARCAQPVPAPSGRHAHLQATPDNKENVRTWLRRPSSPSPARRPRPLPASDDEQPAVVALTHSLASPIPCHRRARRSDLDARTRRTQAVHRAHRRATHLPSPSELTCSITACVLLSLPPTPTDRWLRYAASAIQDAGDRSIPSASLLPSRRVSRLDAQAADWAHRPASASALASTSASPFKSTPTIDNDIRILPADKDAPSSLAVFMGTSDTSAAPPTVLIAAIADAGEPDACRPIALGGTHNACTAFDARADSHARPLPKTLHSCLCAPGRCCASLLRCLHHRFSMEDGAHHSASAPALSPFPATRFEPAPAFDTDVPMPP